MIYMLQAYNMSNLCELNRFQIYREVKLHSSLRHENIISLYAAFQQGDQASDSCSALCAVETPAT